ncbi:hypothetical protein JYU34_011096 [Plutella xylostella]|uniref:Guanine nucleotide-releasing factor 2 n=1 Tax=Plutella xylostella TaxID=51655 RepID=A0ABQ7QG19_PLUXY|nr:hypothetical protein JYU34_011096 [Plutella xylostella]
MPHYDESFIFDDNDNQRRNKRSYHVYKHGAGAGGGGGGGDVLRALEERGTSVIKRNIRNIKQRARAKPDQLARGPDIIIDHCPRITCYDPNKYNDIRNNNVSLASCKSLDNLTLKHAKKYNEKVIRGGTSLQNLIDDEGLQHYSSPLVEGSAAPQRGVPRSYWLAAAARKGPRRGAGGPRAVPPGVGVYRQINGDQQQPTRPTHESDLFSPEPGSGHRGSLRGANKLARRARSFKDDLLERISNMRSPQQQHHAPHLANALRSHSPLSPKLRNMGHKAAADDGELTPAKELERLVKDVTFGLKHFSDVITKRKLEMLPDNGTLVFESIANIHKAIKPYCGRSPPLTNAVKRLCTALAMLIRLCDEITAISLRGEEEETGETGCLAPEHVGGVVAGVTAAVHDVARLAQQHMTRPALDPRPAALLAPRPPAQRNSLPDIPLTPKERSLLTGSSGMMEGGGVRASHSSESVLDAPDSPPPKPARPNRKIELAPPLPPKRKSANDNSLLALSIDGLSLQSHSSGSLDSMLNVSNDEESRHAADGSNHDSVFATPPNSDLVGICICNNGLEGRTSLDSTGHESHLNSSHLHSHSNSNHNRFSNESGFVSVGHQEQSTEHSFTSAFSSHHLSSHTDRLASVTSDESEVPPELPVKTRRAARSDVQQHFPNVEIRASPVCTLHGEGRPHTLADHHPPRPPPLPLKKKHIMAYMEMFGKQLEQNNAAAAPDMFRHSIHTYNLASAQHSTVGSLSVSRQHVQRSIAQSLTVQHFGSTPLSGSEDSVSMTTSSGTSPVPPEPPALPPKMNKNKLLQMNTSNELLPPPSPRPASYNSGTDETILNNSNSEDPYPSITAPGKFPLEDELERLVQPTPSPVPSQRSESSSEPNIASSDANTTMEPVDEDDVILQTDISSRLLFNTDKNGPEVRGGQPDALVVLATKATKDFAYQEAFLATYRTWVGPGALVERLERRAHHFRQRPHELRSTLSLLTRVVADLTMIDLETKLVQKITNFIYWLVEVEELAIAKALRQILVEKQKQLHSQTVNSNHRYEYDSPCYGAVSLSRDTLLDFKSHEIAEQMTLLDAALFGRITTAEVLSWPRDQSEESSPNLTRFTAHFNNMSFWARSRILEQVEAREREKYANKFLKVMKVLRKINNFNSYLALVSALDSPPVRRLGWPRHIEETLREYCALIDSSCSFRAYRAALSETVPPCIPYLGLVLQDLTFVHVGNPDLLADGSINFSKRWQQYGIMENIKRFQKDRQYKFKRNERIQAMFNEFDDVLSEDALWQISKTIKPSDGRSAH